VLAAGQPGEHYLLGGHSERTNLAVVQDICDILDAHEPLAAGQARRTLIQFVEDRPGHDFRYAIDSSRTERELGWRAEIDYASGLRKTVWWYLEHAAWTDQVLASDEDDQRLGLGERPLIAGDDCHSNQSDGLG